ncbi:MAG: hypothetical protein WC379_08120 [Methanoregula sp.]|jgi:hypothetical protein
MRKKTVNKIFCYFLLLFAAAFVLQPVMADNGTISIAYRGSGGGYVGESFVFDGRNTYGNTTFLKVTGPGLPSEGVPANNLNGASGTGTPIEVDKDGEWKFGWYSSSVSGIEKIKTGKYTFTATDSVNPDKSATALIMLKKPEYSITASPNPVNPGNYVELIGIAEQGVAYAKIDISDSSGKVLHSYSSPVSTSGYFNYGFHVDMDPGQYTVSVSNPSLKVPFGTVISVVSENGTVPATTGTVPVQVSAVPTADVMAETTAAPVSNPSATRSPVAPVTLLAALIIGIIASGISRR